MTSDEQIEELAVLRAENKMLESQLNQLQSRFHDSIETLRGVGRFKDSLDDENKRLVRELVEVEKERDLRPRAIAVGGVRWVFIEDGDVVFVRRGTAP